MPDNNTTWLDSLTKRLTELVSPRSGDEEPPNSVQISGSPEFCKSIWCRLKAQNRQKFEKHCEQIKKFNAEQQRRWVDLQGKVVDDLLNNRGLNNELDQIFQDLLKYDINEANLKELEARYYPSDRHGQPRTPAHGFGFGVPERHILNVGGDSKYPVNRRFLKVGGDAKDFFAGYPPPKTPDSESSCLESWLTQFLAHEPMPEPKHDADNNPLGFIGQKWWQEDPKRQAIELKPYATEDQPTLQYQNQHYGLPYSQGMYYYPDASQLHSSNNDYSWETLSRLVAEGVCDLKAGEIRASDFTQEQAQQSCNQLPNDLKNKLINNLSNNEQFEDLSEKDMNDFLNQYLTPPLATYIITGAMCHFYHVKAVVHDQQGEKQTGTEACMKALWQQYYSKSHNKDQDQVTDESQDFAIFKELGFELMEVLREDVKEKQELQHATKLEF